MIEIENLDLAELTDEKLSTLRDRVDEETYRRHMLSTAADSIAELIRGYIDVGGNQEALAEELTDVLATDA